jgi:hypothetical protein
VKVKHMINIPEKSIVYWNSFTKTPLITADTAKAETINVYTRGPLFIPKMDRVVVGRMAATAPSH